MQELVYVEPIWNEIGKTTAVDYVPMYPELGCSLYQLPLQNLNTYLMYFEPSQFYLSSPLLPKFSATWYRYKIA